MPLKTIYEQILAIARLQADEKVTEIQCRLMIVGAEIALRRVGEYLSATCGGILNRDKFERVYAELGELCLVEKNERRDNEEVP